MLSCTSLTIATSALVGVALAPTPALATLPLGLAYLCIMMTMIPASLLMKRYGRRFGFALGGTAGLIGGSTSAFGIYHGSFTLFCIGSAIFGIANGFAQFYRFAAAKIVHEAYKSRAISWVLAGGLSAQGCRFLSHLFSPNLLWSAREFVKIPGSTHYEDQHDQNPTAPFPGNAGPELYSTGACLQIYRCRR